MIRRCLFFLTLLGLQLGATPPTGPGPVLAQDITEAAWLPLFTTLAAQRPVYSRFTEKRWFGFRKTPVVLDGEMRLDEAHGLSLRYIKPEERLMVVDAKGVLLRDAHGRNRVMPPDPRSGGVERALLPALRFDPAEIRSFFVIYAARDGADWRLDLEPKDAGLHRSLGKLLIEGSGEVVHRLEFHRSDSQRVVIEINETRASAVFTAEELQRYFR